MEILNKFKQNGFFTSELYHLLAQKKMTNGDDEITPSQYLKEMRMSSSERLQSLSGIMIDNITNSGRKPEQILLSFTPKLLVFQNYTANDKIVAKFSVKNISKAPTYLNMVWKETSTFAVKTSGSCSGLPARLAPGISITFLVTFSPTHAQDYVHKAIFHTENDQYILPIFAMGPRPVLELADSVVIPSTPLKLESSAQITLKNSGVVPARLTLQSYDFRFRIEPATLMLEEGQTELVRITHRPMWLGTAKTSILLSLETGETLAVNVECSSYTVDVEIEKQKVRFSDTYNTMVRQETFKIINKSQHLLKFGCVNNESKAHDFMEKIYLASICDKIKQTESEKTRILVEYDVLTKAEHKRIYNRIFNDELNLKPESPFHDTHFSVTPVSGELYPNMSTEVTVSFSPKEIGELDALMYLDIDGLSERPAVKMVGRSLPPAILLNLETLDMGSIYINKTYNYEIVATNRGHINGVLVYKPIPTLFGSHIACTPLTQCLKPGDSETYVISFSNSNQGPYFEEINFNIRDTEVVLKLYLKGEIIYPSLLFSVPCLEFDVVSVGVPKSLEMSVINKSIVDVSAILTIPSDGPELSSITLEDFAVADRPKPGSPQWPREFNIQPSKILIGPNSEVLVKVTLTANLIRANQTYLEMELEKSDSAPILLPVKYNAKVPDITPAPEIKLRACFVEHIYDYDIKFSADDLWGYFTIEESDQEATIRVTAKVMEGFIEPNSTINIPITLTTNVHGLQEYSLRIRLFGQSRTIEICHITAVGVRPIVTCTPVALHFGQVKIATKAAKVLTLCNDSPVSVNFRVNLLCRDIVWSIEPPEGTMMPESEFEIVIGLYLYDAQGFTNKAIIQIEKVKDIIVPLSATGTGTSIMVGPLRDRIDLGRHFTKIPLNCGITMFNCGNRLHTLEWSDSFKQPKTKPVASKFFNLDPRSFKMFAGEKTELNINGLSNKATTICDMWYLIGSIEGVNKKELLLECPVEAEFVDPKIEVSSSHLEFQYDCSPYSEYYKLTDIVTIKNVSKLPLDIDLSVKAPFAIIHKRGTYKVPVHEAHLCGCICYQNSDLKISSMTAEFGHKQSKEYIDCLTLKPVEPLRKDPLHFFQDINKIKRSFNLTHTVEEHLEDQEIMKLQILFDTTKHQSLKSKVFCDIMRIRFSGLKNKDAIKLVGRINLPNIFIITSKIDFHCIQNDSVHSKTIKMQNITPLKVCYRLLWKKCTIGHVKQPTEIDYGSNVPEVHTITEDTYPNDLHELLQAVTPVTSMLDKIELLDERESSYLQNIPSSFVRPEIDDDTSNKGSLISEDKDETELQFKIRTLKKIRPILDFVEISDFKWTHKFPKIIKYNFTDLNEVLMLTPHRGLLQPNEIQYIHVIFQPKFDMQVKATLECNVIGGPPEYIQVSAMSSDLKYKINSQRINFKIRPFNERASEILTIINTAMLPFEYKTYLNEPTLQNDLESIILDLIPSEKVLQSEEEVPMNIVVRPGVVGRFKRQFLLEIGHLPHIPIEVFGWGVICQIYLKLPRPGIDEFPESLGYLAISEMTTEYLEAVDDIFINSVSEQNTCCQSEKCFNDPDLRDSWHICSSWDSFPSTMAIELSIERFLVVNHLRYHPDILQNYATGSTAPIPGFHTTPYLLDFGVVITDSTVRCAVDVTNYGPIMAKVYLAKNIKLPMWLSLKLPGKLLAGETGKMELGFSPTSADFCEVEQNVETHFILEVPCGISVPIIVKALCAVPYLATNVKMFDLGAVRCGDKIVSAIPIKNIGKPTCIWYVALKMKTPGHNPMALVNSSGKYDPGEGGWLSVTFKPTMEVLYEGLLIFRFHMNPNRIVIPIVGQGVSPDVHVIGPVVSFPPTLPWADTTEVYFGITNPCSFPVELIFAHSDLSWKDEEEIIQLLSKFYNKPDELLVPKIEPGAGFPHQLYEFRDELKERVQKVMAAEAAAALAAAGKASAASSKSAKAKASPKAPAKVPLSTRPESMATPKRIRTEAEATADEMIAMKEEGVDPLKECFDEHERNESKPRAENQKKGILIFFHGSPCEETEGQELAHSVGKRLGLPTFNIDNLIIEALCKSNNEAKFTIMKTINDMYMQAQPSQDKDEISQRDGMKEGEEAEELEVEEPDEFDTIKMKIEFLSNKQTTPRSKGSDKKKSRGPSSGIGSRVTLGSTTMFYPDLLEILLTEYLSAPAYENGFVVESLTSIVIKLPSVALTTFLKCTGNIENIQLVLCYAEFSKWAHEYEEKQKQSELLEEPETKVYSEEEINQIIKDFEDMDAEEYENASPDLKAIYITHGLEERRLKHMGTSFLERDQGSKKSIKDKSMKSMKSQLHVTGSTESKKKIGAKKDEFRGKQTSEFLMMNIRYNEFMKNTYESLITIANNWLHDEKEIGSPAFGFNGPMNGGGQKKKTRKSELNLSETADLSRRGFPLMFIMGPCLQYKFILNHVLASSTLVQEALAPEEEIDILQSPVDKKEFTVLLSKTLPLIIHQDPLKWQYLNEPQIKHCECNQLTDLNLIDDSTQDNVLSVLTKWHCTCGKRVTSSQTSTSEVPTTSMVLIPHEEKSESIISYPPPLRTVPCSAELSERMVLEPGDLARCKYTFNPQNEGVFYEKRYVEVAGWPESRATVYVTGICDMPRLDSRPKKIFKNFLRRTVEGNIYKLTYLDDLKMFEFGPIFIGPNRVYEESYTLELRNASLMTAVTIIQFFNETNVFKIDKDNITLEPGGRGELTVSAAPTEVGQHTCLLLFCVTDNPEVVTISFTCTGVVPSVTILPLSKSIAYGRLLLYRRQDDRFIVKNDSILSIMWKVRNVTDFAEDFIITKTWGIVPRHDNEVVPVTYIACNVGIISNKQLIIDIYDEEGRGSPMLMDTLHLSAECYDVRVEYAFENPNENFLNYGNVKVNSRVARVMFLLNRGKYNIYYKIKKVKTFPEPSLLKTMDYTPTGIVPNTMKVTVVEFVCKPTVSMNLVNEPAFICSLLDGNKNQVVVAKFPVCLSIASFYNTFTLFPLGELNFNVIPIGTRVTRDVILNNTSKCPITYKIVLPMEHTTDMKPSSAKGDKNKLKSPSAKTCGNFTILSEDGVMAPGASKTLQMQFFASAAKKFEETIKFIVSDTCPAEAEGVPLRLVGVGAMPNLDFWNLEVTFREHLILKNLSEYNQPESIPHCVFVEDSVSLHFFCVSVNTSHTAVVDLYNNGLVACALSMRLIYQNNSGPDIFALDKYETHIEPLMHKNLGIIFSPKALTEYRTVLEIELKLLDNQKKSYKVCLIGVGVIPRIEMIEPHLKHKKIGLVKLPVTCLGSTSNKNIVFQNISTVQSMVLLDVKQKNEDRLVFSLDVGYNSEHMLLNMNNDDLRGNLQVVLKPKEVATVMVNYNPLFRGQASCDVVITIADNPYEFYTIICEGEAFMEDVIITGLQMLSLNGGGELEERDFSTTSSMDVKKSHSAITSGKKKKDTKDVKAKKSQIFTRPSPSGSPEPSTLKYLLNFGGCELGSLQRRSFVMSNNSDKVYKFTWEEQECLTVKPSVGYISPGEEKDVEIMFFSLQPVDLDKEMLNCSLVAVSDDTLTLDVKGTTWDNRQCLTVYEHNKEMDIHERFEDVIEEQVITSADTFGLINMIIFYSASTQYIKYQCNLVEEKTLPDTFIYQTRCFKFKVTNVGKVAMKMTWSFQFDEEFPARIDKTAGTMIEEVGEECEENTVIAQSYQDNLNTIKPTVPKEEESKVTLFSGSLGMESVDTWFEVDMPFTISPDKGCLKPNESQIFVVTFAPLEAFAYRIRLKSNIENLDPYDQNISCNIIAKSLIPYVHLDIPASDYLKSGQRKETGVPLPQDLVVLEFNVLGNGCYKKTFNVVNPTSEGYEFTFEMVMSEKPDLVPVHCDMLKGFVEGGTSVEVAFTFAPTAPGVYESLWKFNIFTRSIVINILVVGLVREPKVLFLPTILIIRNSLVGFTNSHSVILRNPESESLKFHFKGNSLCNESGKTPVVVHPEEGVLKPCSDTVIKIIYTPADDGPVSFKIFCSITYLTKFLTLCVNALSYSINPKVTYELIGVEHVLDSEVITNINLDQTASTYERTVPFTISNEGSAAFVYEWQCSSSAVRRVLQVRVEPRAGHVPPGARVHCTLHFTLARVPVHAFPVTLTISDGPEYEIYLFAEIEKPSYRFSCMEIDFGKCITNAPDDTYRKTMAIFNNDKEPIRMDLNFSNLTELVVEYEPVKVIEPSEKLKITLFFRPKQAKEYEFKLQYWINSMCEEIVIVRGEGVPLLFDLYEGCQKSFDMGPVKVGEKVAKQIEVMNHSKVAIDATFIFRDMYPTIDDDATNSEATSICLSPSTVVIAPVDPGLSRLKLLQRYKDDKVRDQIAMDIQNALSSLRVVPSKARIKPHRKVPLKIHFKPVGMISKLDVQLNMKVLNVERPLVRLSGSATGMSLVFSQNSLQFGRVRRRGCKIMKVMLMNKGDFGTRFWWQPLISDEFVISPAQGDIAARTNVTFTITFRPKNYNPFIKVWASCNIENYTPLELAIHAACMDVGTVQNKTLYFDVPVREVQTEYVTVTNPSDDVWLVLCEITEGPFETLKEFNIEANSTFDIPVTFKPKMIGKHQSQVLYSPLGESALFVTLTGTAAAPSPAGDLAVTVAAKELHVEELLVHNLTECPETYIVRTELVKVVPDKFEGYYEVRCPDAVRVWGEAAATCRWAYVCYEPCEMQLKVYFIDEKSREYQFYNISVLVLPSEIVDTITFVCKARETVQKELLIKNPLSNDAQFFITCEQLKCPNVLNIPRSSEGHLTMQYSPLVVGHSEEIMEVSNHLAGTYLYKMILKCLPATEKDLEFSTPFGSAIHLRLRVQNRTDIRTDFVTELSHPCIIADKKYPLGPLEKGKFLVWFEPTQLGVQRCTVSFDSPVAGQFVFNIKGTGEEPKPQGPYDIRVGGHANIIFKNVYDETKMFKINIDREEFYVKTSFETVKSKKEVKIQVYLTDKINPTTSSLPSGCMTVEIVDPAEAKVHWTFFLQGVP